MKNYKSLNYAVTFIIAMLLFAVTTLAGMLDNTRAYAAESGYDATNVLDDLKGATIAGKAFNLADYPYRENGDAQLITFAEYGYSPVKDRQSDYGLYAYIYNPQQTELDVSDRNKIQFRYGNMRDYVKYSMTLLNYSTQAGYERLFYKFRIELTASQRSVFLATLNPTERKYEISGIELSLQKNVKEYPVGQIYTYSGTAGGYGADQNAGSTLSCRVDGFKDLIQFDVNHTVYRPQGDFYRGGQSQLNSCFFRVPNRYLDDYGELTAVLAEWWERMIKPVLVTEDYDTYVQLSSLHGAALSELAGKYAFLCQAIGDVKTYNWPKLISLLTPFGAGIVAPGYSDYDTYAWASNIAMGEEYGWAAWYDIAMGTQVYKSNFPPELNFENFSAVFYTGGTPYPYEQAYVKPSELKEKLLNNSAALKDFSVNGKYSKQLFYGFDGTVDDDNFSGYNRAKITTTDTKHLTWNTVIKSNSLGVLKQIFLGEGEKNSFGNEVTSALVKVTAEDLDGDAETVSERLKIGKGEVSQLKDEFRRAGKSETVFLCRYSTTTYFSAPCGTCLRDVGNKDESTYDDRKTMARNVLKQNRNLDGLSPSAYIAIETVQLDFDIIDLEFTKDDVTTVIPVVSDPTDAIGGISPPLKEVKSDAKIPWWVWVIIVVVIVIVALVLICIFVPGAAPVIGKGLKYIGIGIWRGIYYLFYGLAWTVILPFRALAGLVKKLKARRAEDTKRNEALRREKLNRKANMKVARYQNKLVRKEQIRQRKRDIKDEIKEQQRKSKQAEKAAKRRKKAARGKKK